MAQQAHETTILSWQWAAIQAICRPYHYGYVRKRVTHCTKRAQAEDAAEQAMVSA